MFECFRLLTCTVTKFLNRLLLLSARFSIQRERTVIRNVVPRAVQAQSESDTKVRSYDCYFRDP
jgi:hypothetical protein